MRRLYYRSVCVCRRIYYLICRLWLSEPETAAYKLRTRQIEGVTQADGVILSYPKSGRTWVETMLSHLYVRKLGLPATRVLRFEEDHRESSDIPYLFFTHDYAHVTHGQWLLPKNRSRRFYRNTPTLMIARHPIDTAVSMFFQQSRREGNVVEAEVFDFVRSHEGGLATTIHFLNLWAEELPRIRKHKLVRYEDLAADTNAVFGAIEQFFGLGFEPSDIREAVAFAGFENLQRLEKAGDLNDWRFSEGAESDDDRLKVRRGKVGGYADYFDEAQCRELEKIVADTLDPVYGYLDGKVP